MSEKFAHTITCWPARRDLVHKAALFQPKLNETFILRDGQRFPVLPPVPSPPTQSKRNGHRNNNKPDYLDDREFDRRLDEALRNVSTRKIEVMLMELRKKDRDRDRSLHPVTVENIVRKYEVPVTDIMEDIHYRFEDPGIPGQTHYEDMAKYFLRRRKVV